MSELTDLPTRTIRMNFDLLESVVLAFLYQNNLIKDKEMAIGIDFDIPVDDDNFVELDIIYDVAPEVISKRGHEDYHLQD